MTKPAEREHQRYPRHRLGTAAAAVALSLALLTAAVPTAIAEEPADTFNIKRTGAPANANFDLDGVDDYRVDSAFAVLDAGVMEPEEITPSVNFIDRTDCANPDPRHEETLDEEGNPLYEPPDPEDPDWEPNPSLDEAAEGLPWGAFGPFGCLNHSGTPFPYQQKEAEEKVNTESRARKIAGIDGFSGLGGPAAGAGFWSVRAATTTEHMGTYIDPITYPLTVAGAGFNQASFVIDTIECAEPTLSGEIAGASWDLSLQAGYGGCKTAESSLPTSVETNSCNYTLKFLNEGPFEEGYAYRGALGVACEEAEDAIEFKTYDEPEGTLICTTSLLPQEPQAGLELDNEGEGDEKEVKVKGEVSGLEYESAGSECPTESRSDGTIGGETSLGGSRGEEEPQVGVAVVGAEAEEEKDGPRLVAVPVYMPEMGTAHAIAGLDWITDHADELDAAMVLATCPRKGDPLVEELGIEGLCETAGLDEAANAAIDEGVVLVTLAGNFESDVGHTVFPSRPDVVAVSHVVDTDSKRGGQGPPVNGKPDEQRNSDSAYGLMVDMAAAGFGDTNRSTTHVTGAVAALASQCHPEDRAGVEYIIDTLMAEGDTGTIAKGGWKDDSGDGWKEPLLNLRDEEVFDPILIDTETEEKEEQAEDCSWRSHQASSDVNGDGRSDLLALNAQTRSAELFAGTYEGPHEDPRKLGYEIASPSVSRSGELDPALLDGRGSYALDSADVTGDRHADLVTVRGGEGVYVYPGAEDGSFGAPVESLAGATLSFDGTEGQNEPIAVADVTGDERADLIVRYGPLGNIITFRGEEDGSFGTAAFSLGGSVDSALLDGEGHYFLDAVDVTGEELDEPEAEEVDYEAKHSYADLVTISTDGNVYVHPGKEDGKFKAAVTAAEIDPVFDDGEGVEPVGLGDIDRDRRADLLYLEGETLKLLLGTAEGTFEGVEVEEGKEEPYEPYEGKVDSSLLDGEGEELVGLLDYTRDGLADLVSVTDEGEVLVYTAQRDKTFAEPVALEGSLSTLRNEPDGHELLAERPFLRRAGCEAEGCQWTPPAHVPRFESKGYPIEIAGAGPGSLSTETGTISCEQSDLTGELGAPTDGVDLDAAYSECEVGVGVGAEVQMNSCHYTLAALNSGPAEEGPPYEGALGIACEEAEDAIESIAKFNGNPICTTSLGPQSGLEGIALSETGEGAERSLVLDAEVEGLSYTQSGNCGEDAGEDGMLTLEATISGEAYEAPAAFYVAGEELALGLFLEGEESAEEAKQPRLEAEGYPLAVEAFGQGQSGLLGRENYSLSCEEATYWSELAAADDEIDLRAHYAGCLTEATIEGEEYEYPATTVAMNSCRYVMHVANAGPPYEGTLDVACEEEGDAIELKTYLYGTPENPSVLVCKATVGPQQDIGEVSLANAGKGNERGVPAELQLEGIDYSLAKVGCPEGSYEDGTSSVQTTLEGVG